MAIAEIYCNILPYVSNCERGFPYLIPLRWDLCSVAHLEGCDQYNSPWTDWTSTRRRQSHCQQVIYRSLNWLLSSHCLQGHLSKHNRWLNLHKSTSSFFGYPALDHNECTYWWHHLFHIFDLYMSSVWGVEYHLGQVFLKLRHESGVEHLYLLKLSGKCYELTLVHFLCKCVDPVLVNHYEKVHCLLQSSEAFLN